MPKSILFLLGLISLVACVSGYGFYVDCPDSGQIGSPVKCSIDSDFPQGTTFDIIFYKSGNPDIEVSRQSYTVMDNHATQYKLLDTQGLSDGNYKVEALYKGAGEPRLRSDAVTRQILTLTVRPVEIITTLPMIITTVQTTIIPITTIPNPTPLPSVSTPVPMPTLTLSPSVSTPIPMPTPSTTVTTVTMSAAPTTSVQDLINEQNKKIDEQNKLIAEQNKKLESQNDLLTQFLSKFKSIFGWN